MAVNRRLVSSHFPYLPLRLSVGDYSGSLEALVDTGFDGDVALPPGLLANGGSPDEYLTWALADGSEVLAAAFLGAARLGDLDPFPVLVTVLGDEPLMGRGIIDRFRVILDHGQRVVLEP